jgi:5-methylcytosine-specific restriction enzyme subunit McrC
MTDRRSELRTIVLRERQSRACWLSPDDVRFLLERHPNHIAVAPTGRRHRYRLTPAGHVGVIAAPGVRLVIRPKIPLRSLFFLLDPAAAPVFTPDETIPVPGGEALNFLAARLVQLLEERAAAGLHRGYSERAEPGSFLQGRLDVAAQTRDPAARRDQLHCSFEEFGADVPCNQLPRATAEHVLRCPLVADGVRSALRRALRPFEAVNPAPLTADAFAQAAPDRLTEAYRPLLEVCWLLVEGLGPSENAGAFHCPTFLLDMERVFERHVTAAVVRGFSERGRYTVAVQPPFQVIAADGTHAGVRMQPDVVVSRGGEPWLVVDAKWKRLNKNPLITEDFYQVLAYCTALGVKRAALVYPGRRDRRWTYRLERAGVRINVLTLRVVGEREQCAAAVERLGRQILRV